MVHELKRDILKLFHAEKPKSSYTLRGVDGLTADDIANLLTYCRLYENEGEIAEGWKERCNVRMADVLVKYDMW